MKKIIALFVTVLLAFSFVGCNRNKVDDGEQTLEVYLWEAGYGTEWLTALLEDFSTLDWVKQAYPNFKYATVMNDDESYAESRLNSGGNTTIDLFLGSRVEGLYGTDVLLDLTELVYENTVPGEDGLFKDKVLPSVLEANAYYPVGGEDGDPAYYSVPWASGMGGLVYNKTLFDELNLDVPNTTDELLALCGDVKALNGKNAAYNKSYTFISSKVAYSGYMFPTWWAQYESAEQYTNYYKGINYDGVRNSVDVVSQRGRLESLKVFEQLYTEKNGYYDRSSVTFEFIAGQTRLLTRDGLIMACGDWFSSEMRDLAADYAKRGYTDVMSMMRSPVISSITDKTPSIISTAEVKGITKDALLSQVIDEIDAGKTSSEIDGVSQADFDIVRSARGVIYSIGPGQISVIPQRAKAKDVAVDFLRYMATDRANRLYAEYTYGASLPFDYNIKEKAPDLVEKLTTEDASTFEVQNARIDIMETDYATILPYPNNFPLVRYGGLGAIITKYGNLETSFMSNSSLTAVAVAKEDRDYWTEENNKRWNLALSKAGML